MSRYTVVEVDGPRWEVPPTDRITATDGSSFETAPYGDMHANIAMYWHRSNPVERARLEVLFDNTRAGIEAGLHGANRFGWIGLGAMPDDLGSSAISSAISSARSLDGLAPGDAIAVHDALSCHYDLAREIAGSQDRQADVVIAVQQGIWEFPRDVEWLEHAIYEVRGRGCVRQAAIETQRGRTLTQARAEHQWRRRLG